MQSCSFHLRETVCVFSGRSHAPLPRPGLRTACSLHAGRRRLRVAPSPPLLQHGISDLPHLFTKIERRLSANTFPKLFSETSALTSFKLFTGLLLSRKEQK